MVDEVGEVLAARPGGRYVDATIGEGGHAERLLEDSSPDGALLGLDWDEDALGLSRKRLERFGARVTLARRPFGELRDALEDAGWGDGADGILIDLGVSTLQLGRAERGFSFAADGPLDMRMDRRRPASAADLVNELRESELADLLYELGEERASRRIARTIVARRTQKPFATTAELRAAVAASGVRGRPGHDPATRTFQALRIAVNDELGEIERVLDRGWELLRPGGRMAVLSYHSLEDRMVKQAFKRWTASCICPSERPRCDCGWSARVRSVVRRRQRPTPEEIEANPRARSAGLRAVERLPPAGD